jgi:hypothetical protein
MHFYFNLAFQVFKPQNTCSIHRRVVVTQRKYIDNPRTLYSNLVPFLPVTGIWRDPIPGWVENLHGPTGLLVGAGKGVIRSMHCRSEFSADIMPCDIAINTIIILAWRVATLRFVSVSLSHTISVASEIIQILAV